MASNESLSAAASVAAIPGIGPTYSHKLSRLQIASVRDLLHHYPSRFLDYRKQTAINEIRPKTDVSFLATLGEAKRFNTKSGKSVTTVTAEDRTGKINLTWFNNPYIGRLIKPGEKYLIAGKASFFSDKITLISATIEPTTGQSLHTHGLVPIYPLTAGISSRFLRQKIKLALAKTTLPESYAASLHAIHFPIDPTDHLAADKRLAFNHHLLLNITNLAEIRKLPPSPDLVIDRVLHRHLVASLPFKLTPGQLKAVENSYPDLTQTSFTHRLIQGETGSGKTVVAFFLAAQALAARQSLCLLAPTKILASQHYQTFLKFGLPKNQVALITGKKPLTKVPPQPTIFIGTHALLTQLPQKLTFPLAAVVIDEQHKFGVKQRGELLTRQPTPHLFNLTATPIPRTLALGLFGEVAITNLAGKPKNRLPVKTWVLDQSRFEKSTTWLKQQVEQGSKIFAVAPTIHGLGEKAGAEKIFKRYQTTCGSFTPVYLIHGQMKSETIEKTLSAFKKAQGGILVATTIIEVGVDIPEADVIIVHGADNFGLATLHQLRGRVGRAFRQGYCLLVSDSNEEEANTRLKLMEKYHSGLTLAKMDLRLRGAGELFGDRQHGWLPVRLKNFWNKTLFKQAKSVAIALLEKDEPRALAIARRLAAW